MLSEIRVTALDYEYSCSTIEGGIKCNSKELIANGTKEKRQIREQVRNELSDLLDELEDKFRQLLGGDKISWWQKIKHQLMRLYSYISRKKEH